MKPADSLDKQKLIEELKKITSDETVINFIASSTTSLGVDVEYKKLLEEYEEEK